MNDMELDSAQSFAGKTFHAVYATQSPEINELATALAKAQGGIEGAVKERTNPFFKSSYADLTSVWDACREALSKNGLAVIQTTACTNGAVTLITTLAHSSGQWIRGTWPIKPVKEDPQGYVSAVTYGRRVCLASMVGVAPKSDDDDAEGASGRKAPPGDIKTAEDKTGGYPKNTAAKVWAKNKTELKKMAQTFSTDLEACTDYDQLIAFLNTAESMGFLSQYEQHMPEDYFGDGEDVLGLKYRIDFLKADLAAAQEPRDA